jgi:Transglycosylase-like domain
MGASVGVVVLAIALTAATMPQARTVTVAAAGPVSHPRASAPTTTAAPTTTVAPTTTTTVIHAETAASLSTTPTTRAVVRSTTTTTVPVRHAAVVTPTTVRPAPVATAPVTAPPAPVPTSAAAVLACIRQRESGNNYAAVSASGTYRGAYQFSQGTWDGAARLAGRPDLVGRLANTVAPADQDAVALAEYEAAGLAPWGGHCP